MTAESPTALHAPALEDCRIVELRDYLLHPGQRDALIELSTASSSSRRKPRACA